MTTADSGGPSPRWALSQSLTWRLDDVAARFPRYLDLYDRASPDILHAETIARLRKLGGAVAAANDDEFTANLLRILRNWRVFRGLKGGAPDVGHFRTALKRVVPVMSGWTDAAIDDDGLDVAGAAAAINEAVLVLAEELHRASTPMVLGTKTLHHLLPDLVPPMDRENTMWFFAWSDSKRDMNPPRVYDAIEQALWAFNRLAAMVKPAQYVTERGWRTSTSKMLDNAICAYRR